MTDKLGSLVHIPNHTTNQHLWGSGDHAGGGKYCKSAVASSIMLLSPIIKLYILFPTTTSTKVISVLTLSQTRFLNIYYLFKYLFFSFHQFD